MYSFSGNSVVSVPISTFMCLWAIYIVPGSVYIFPPAESGDPSWEYINRTHEWGNWDWDRDIPFLGIFFSKLRYFVFAVQSQSRLLDYKRKGVNPGYTHALFSRNSRFIRAKLAGFPNIYQKTQLLCIFYFNEWHYFTGEGPCTCQSFLDPYPAGNSFPWRYVQFPLLFIIF